MEAVFCSNTICLKKTWFFWVFGIPKKKVLSCLSVPHLADNYAKLWKGGVGALCAIAHYRAFLLIIDPGENLEGGRNCFAILPSSKSRNEKA